VNILYTNLGQYTVQNKELLLDEAMVPWGGGAPEIYDIQSRENNKIWSAGENGVWAGIVFYLQHGDILSWGNTVLSLLDRNLGQ